MDNVNKTIKIYFADTEGEELDKLASYFEAKGDKYEIVGKGSDGMVVAGEVLSTKPDFLVTEVLLAGADGFKVLEMLKKEMGARMPKIIFVSNLSHAGFISKALKEGVSYFMVKPISPENLEERILDLSNPILNADGDKALDEKGEKNSELRETPDKRLKRHCYFLMDEFGSLPPIKNFDNIIKIARSLGVFMIPVLQDYAQLNKVYGEQPASTIKNNCNVKIFLGTNDEKTRGEISEACGQHKVKSVSYSENKDTGVNTSAQSVPLIYPHELANLNNPADGVFGNAVVIASGVNPIMSHTTPCFKAFDIFGIEGEARPPEKAFMIFDEQTNRYDITKLIFLHHNLEDDSGGEEEVSDTENPIEIQPNDTEKGTKRKTAAELAAEQISEELEKLKGKISEDDFVRLCAADIKEKLRILDELAEAATLGGNIFLAMQIEKIISFIKHSSNKSVKE